MAEPIASIASLTDEQAIHAIELFYEFSAAELWEEDEKPEPERVRKIAEALLRQAPADIRPAVEMLVEDGRSKSMAARAEVGRLLLSQLRQSPAFLETVDRAVEAATLPHKAIDPFTGIFIIAILLATSKIDAKGFHPQTGAVNVIKALRLPELLRALPPVLKALPDSIWKRLTG